MPLPLLFAPWQRYGHDWAASIFLPWMPQYCLPCGFLFLEVTSYDSGWGKYGNLVRIRHCFPGPGRKIELCLAAHSGRLAPPRFSRSCPHCLRLWLDRGTIVGRQGHGETACRSCFWLGVVRSLLGRGFPLPSRSWRILLIAFLVCGLSADVIQSPDMTIPKNGVCQGFGSEELICSSRPIPVTRPP